MLCNKNRCWLPDKNNTVTYINYGFDIFNKIFIASILIQTNKFFIKKLLGHYF